MIYLDHAATSWPKPPEVIEAMRDFLERAGGNPGRSGHRLSTEAGRVIYDTRDTIADFFNASDPLRVIFTCNATHAINIALFGLLRPGDTVVTTDAEHNAVMRPLRSLEQQGIKVKSVQMDSSGALDFQKFEAAVAQGARMVVLHHASNVIGNVMPVSELAHIARSYGVLVLVDAAQTAGVCPIDVQEMGIDLLAFTGHKGLQGPPGVGGLVMGERVDVAEMRPLVCGGTGSSSESEEQPEKLPDKLESGTPNGVGIAGLGAGVKWVMQRGLDNIRDHHSRLMEQLIRGLSALPGLTLFGPAPGAVRGSLVSFRVSGLRVSDVCRRLDDEFGVLCRVGLHCAPGAHKVIGTFPEGAVRFSIGPMISQDDIKCAIKAVARIAG